MTVLRVCDTVVVGGGVFGLATAAELGRRGRKVILIDRFGSGHPATSSTGASRSIRIAYSEPFYVDLALEALSRWAELERATGRTILHQTGQVDLGPQRVLDALAESSAKAGAPLQRRTAAQLREVLPELSDKRDGLFHTQAGTVMAAEGMEALRSAATNAGVHMLMPETVLAIEPGEPVVVRTSERTVEAERVVVAAGPWTGGLLEPLGISVPLAPAVAQVTFLDAPGMVDRPALADWPDVEGIGVYGHPVPGIGYKLAFDAGTEGWDPDTEKWSPNSDEEAQLLGWMIEHLRGVPRRVAYSQRHPWTLTPDSDFVIDRRGPVVLACGCSGHAFKFGPALGTPVADVVDGAPANPLFSLDRAGLLGASSAVKAIGR
ncbi:MAG: FAD-dependent oxidoreductase [Actinomycetes bacterium]